MISRIRCAAIALGIALGLTSSARAADLIGADFFGMLYDMTESGAVSNPRSTGIGTLSGIALGQDGVLYGIDAATDVLWQINIATGASSPVGFLGLDVTEGDLSVDPTTGQLYGVQSFGADRLYTIDTASGAGTPVGAIIANGDISAIAFDDAGNLFALDTGNDVLYRVDSGTAAILQTYPLMLGPTTVDLGPSAGMVFDSVSGNLYFADGGPNGTDQFYLFSTALQILFPFGQLTLPGGVPLENGLSGMAYVPEPATACMLLAAGLLIRRRRSS